MYYTEFPFPKKKFIAFSFFCPHLWDIFGKQALILIPTLSLKEVHCH